LRPIVVLKDLTGDNNFNKMEKYEFEDEEMDSESSISDTSIDSTMTHILSDSDVIMSPIHYGFNSLRKNLFEHSNIRLLSIQKIHLFFKYFTLSM
jgi:hypothetical protein